jgi:uncharacterized membrane protein (UPF0127 family)
MTVVNRTRGHLLGDQILLADGFLTRLRGLLGHPELTEGEGLLILPSGGVHMFGMKYALDVLLLDRDRRVVASYPELSPGSRTRMHKNARAALELPVGAIGRSGTEDGDEIEWNSRGGASSP